MISSGAPLDQYNAAIRAAKSMGDLPEPLMTLLNLASLLVDIEFRKDSDKSLDWSRGRRYRVVTMKEVLPDQLTPADKALEGSQQELFG